MIYTEVPSNTIYFTVPTGGAVNVPFIVGRTYTIATTGSTNFTAIGAANNTPGTVFIATGAGSGTGTANPTSYIAIDRNPSEAHSIRMIEYTQETTLLKQARADGINIKEIEVSFTVKGEVEELNLIVAFFSSKKGVLDFTLYNPLSSNIKLVVDQWAIGLQNYNFGVVQAKGRLCY